MVKRIAFILALIMCLVALSSCSIAEDSDEIEALKDEISALKDALEEKEDEESEKKGNVRIAKNVTVIFRVPVMVTDEETGEQVPKLDENGYPIYEDKFKYDIPEITGTVELRDPETGKTIKAPTVLSAVEVAFKKYQKEFELSKDGTYIAAAFGYKESEVKYIGGGGYREYWDCKIINQDASVGNQNVTRIYTDDIIVFTWTINTIKNTIVIDPSITIDDFDFGDIEIYETVYDDFFGETETVETMDHHHYESEYPETEP